MFVKLQVANVCYDITMEMALKSLLISDILEVHNISNSTVTETITSSDRATTTQVIELPDKYQTAVPVYVAWCNLNLNCNCNSNSNCNDKCNHNCNTKNGSKVSLSSDTFRDCCNFESYINHKEFFEYLVSQLLGDWETLFSAIYQLTGDIQREVCFRIPFDFVPESYLIDMKFIKRWIALNKHQTITLIVDNEAVEYEFGVTECPDGIFSRIKEQHSKLEFYSKLYNYACTETQINFGPMWFDDHCSR